MPVPSKTELQSDCIFEVTAMPEEDHQEHDHSGHSHGMGGVKAILEGHGRSRTRLWWALGINFVFLIVEFVGGLITGSLALMSDAGHMLTDVAALAMALVAAHLASRPRSPRLTFGLLRAEVVGAFLNGCALVVIVGLIFWHAWQRLGDPHEIEGGLMLGIAISGLLANAASAAVLMPSRKDSLNIRGAFLHLAADALGSVGAIVAGIVILTTGWTPIDTITSLVIGMLILGGSIALIRQAIDVLLNATPPGIDFGEVKEALEGIDHFEEIEDLHIWNVVAGLPVLTCHARLKEGCMTAQHWHDSLAEARDLLRKRFAIEHVTIQVEPSDHPGHNRII
jgi:cobalt-zinc-cadmium efflux system protein